MPQSDSALDCSLQATRGTGARIGRSSALNLRHWSECAALTLLAASTAGLVVLALLPFAFSWHLVLVQGASMQPAIPLGGLEIVAAAHPADLAPGDIVLHRSPEVPSRLVTHRIVDISADRQFVTTRGDANSSVDAPVPIAAVVGRYKLSVPFVGYLVLWLRSGLGRTLAVVLPGFAIGGLEMMNLIRVVRDRRARPTGFDL